MKKAQTRNLVILISLLTLVMLGIILIMFKQKQEAEQKATEIAHSEYILNSISHSN